jgi:hypothetical protein
MGFLPFGGFVFSIDGGNYIGSKKGIDDETFKKIAAALYIPKEDIDQLIAHNPRSVYVYRGGGKTETPPFVTVAGSSGSGGRGSGGGGSSGS